MIRNFAKFYINEFSNYSCKLSARYIWIIIIQSKNPISAPDWLDD